MPNVGHTELKDKLLPIYFIVILSTGGVVGIIIEIYDSPLGSFLAGAGLIWPISLIFSIFLVKRRSRLHTSWKKTILNSILAISTMILVPFGFHPPEGKFIFNPGVDTEYTPGYTETHFQQIAAGMTEEQVTALLGEPFSKITVNNTKDFDTVWLYTNDGACSWGDFAWIRKQIELKNGFVVSRGTGWSYD